MTSEQLEQFIKESNAIENEYSLPAFMSSEAAYYQIANRKPPLTLLDILTVHQYIAKGLEPNIAGKLRGEVRYDSQVGKHTNCRYYDVPNRLCTWLRDIRKVKWDEDSINFFHVRFEKIHPFVDFNGRTGRIIWLWMREQAVLPFKLIRADTKKTDYYTWFE